MRDAVSRGAASAAHERLHGFASRPGDCDSQGVTGKAPDREPAEEPMSNLDRMMEARARFEQACADQNARRDVEVAVARETASPCDVVDMLAFGGVPYCRTHRVMGECRHGRA